MGFNFTPYSKIQRQSQIVTLPLDDCLAKTGIATDGTHIRGCTVEAHLKAVCYVLRELRKHFNNTPLSAILLSVAEWLCALHDIGKLTPVFQQKIYAALGISKDFGMSFPMEKENHGLSTQLILRSRFGERFARVAAAHHGFGFLSTSFYTEQSPWLGGPEWEKLRESLISNLTRELNLPDFNPNELDEKIISVLLGAVILADWLGSSMDIPYGMQPTSQAAAKAVAAAGFIPYNIRKDLGFADIFRFTPNALQSCLLREIHPGGCYIIEAEMGSGKTEAALYLAYKLLENKKATGIYFALPTQLTSEKIHSRMDNFLSRILADADAKESLLIHGSAWLNWDLFMENDDGVACHKPNSWFYAPKRAMLAPFAVGTIDQALMSVINVRHKDLRAFALAGKVVIIDEIHSYDTYTGTLVNELVHQLKNWGCTVIILSATLSAAARKNLFVDSGDINGSSSASYPMVSMQQDGQLPHFVAVPPVCRKSVQIINTTKDEECIKAALCAAKDGQQVLWIENTVRHSQKLYQIISAAALGTSIEVGLIHSRFTQAARSANESRWVALYGKDGSQERLRRGRILIGTQILEQSIDIDADLLITRLAPSDMLLQRIGRLWRHQPILQRSPSARCKAIILHSVKYDQVKNLFASRKDDLPYERYILLRTQEIWWQLAYINIPDDIRPIIEGTYSERVEDDSICKLKTELDKCICSMHQQALVSTSAALNVIDDEVARTRLNDLPQVQLLIIAKNNRGDDLSKKIWLPFSDEPIAVPSRQAPMSEKKAVLKKLYAQMIKTSEYCAPAYESFTLDEALGNLMFLGDNDCRPIRAAYLDQSGYLRDKASNYVEHNGERLKYSRTLGLQIIKDDT